MRRCGRGDVGAASDNILWQSYNPAYDTLERTAQMEKRQVGQTELTIDTLGLGGAPLGGNFVEIGYGQAAELIQAAKDAGIGYFDTAPWYGFGRSERVMGDLLRHSDYILSDKVGRLLCPGPVADPSRFGMIDPLPFHVIYDYSYDASCAPSRTACNALASTGSIYCLRMISAPSPMATRMPAISGT